MLQATMEEASRHQWDRMGGASISFAASILGIIPRSWAELWCRTKMEAAVEGIVQLPAGAARAVIFRSRDRSSRAVKEWLHAHVWWQQKTLAALGLGGQATRLLQSQITAAPAATGMGFAQPGPGVGGVTAGPS